MAQLVPLLDYVHEIRAAGVPGDTWEIIDNPLGFWERLPAERRQAFLERANLGGAGDVVTDARVVKRRGKAASHENVFVRLEVEPRAFRTSVKRARDRMFFEPVDDRETLEKDIEAFNLPQTVFREASVGRKYTPIIGYLDRVWGGDPYDTERDGILCVPAEIPGFQPLEGYWVEEPFAHVSLWLDEDQRPLYHVDEPPLSPLERALLVSVNQRLPDVLHIEDDNGRERTVRVVQAIFDQLRAFRIRASRSTAYKLGYYFVRNYMGFGRLEPVMRDPAVEDVSCNGVGIPVYLVHARHQNVRTELLFDELELNGFAIKLAQRGGKLLSVAEPLVDATLHDGSRIQASLGREVTAHGSAFTIRKFREDPLTAVDLIRGGTHTLDTMAFLWLAVELKLSLVVMGATASGKTTTLNALSQFIPGSRKIVSIEDTREIKLQHENWLPAVTRDSVSKDKSERVTMYHLLKAALRQRPEYIIVGEIRAEEGLTLFQAMSTGHTCYSTMHAGSVENAVYRLENPPIQVPRVMLTSLDFFLLQGLIEVRGKPVRRMLALAEIHGIDAGTRNLRTSEVFRFDAAADSFVSPSPSAVLDLARTKRGWTRSRMDEELAARRTVLDRLVRNNARHYGEVARAVREFQNERVSDRTIQPKEAGAVRTAPE